MQEQCSPVWQTPPVGKRQDARERTERQIIEVGRAHLATQGAAGLSLRAIARELGLVSSAVYRYVASRDDLLTLLLIDAYTDLADAVDEAGEGTDDWRARLTAQARAARAWAVGDPARWALLYGSPVPGYHAPSERTVGPGTRVVGSLFGTIAEGIAAGEISASNGSVPEPTSTDFDGIRAEFSFSGDDAAVMKCLTLWGGLVGAISLEVFGQYGADTFSDAGLVFDGQVGLLIDLLAATG